MLAQEVVVFEELIAEHEAAARFAFLLRLAAVNHARYEGLPIHSS